MICKVCGADKNLRKCKLCNQTFCLVCKEWTRVRDPPPTKTLSDGTKIVVKVLKMHYECEDCIKSV
jgi:hypothetical protein